MKTQFTVDQLADPATAASAAEIRRCVHCGFCTATCPTYVLLGDELDSPRGRIYLMKDMLENQRRPTAEVVKHIDRCLSCLSCVTTCPSGVNYAHLVDHARAYIEDHYRRPWPDRFYRALLAAVLPHPKRFRAALSLARLTRFAAPMLRSIKTLRPLAAMLDLAPKSLPHTAKTINAASQHKHGKVVMLQGCAEPVLSPQIREAAVRLLNRAGVDVAFAAGEGCCGALTQHIGKENQAMAAARRNVDAWHPQIEAGLTAIVVTASGCGSQLKTYGWMLRNDPVYADRAAAVSALARDIVEVIEDVGLPPVTNPAGLIVAYHAACSLQHGQQIRAAPKALLAAAGFTVREPLDGHLCCGSAGTYNILQSEIAGQLRARKVETLEALAPDVIAAGNIGCLTQIAHGSGLPVVHTVELLDWATGGPRPPGL